MSGTAGRGTVVAVVSDGSGIAGGAVATPLSPALARHAALIEERAGLATKVMALASDRHMSNVLDGLPGDVGAVFLPHTDHRRAVRAQSVAGGLPVVTEQDTTAIALTAALLTTLSRVGCAPALAQVVVAGEQSVPILCPLLIAAGIGDLTTWNPTDAIAFPLPRIASDAHAVLTLPTDSGRRADAVAVAVPSDAAPAVIAADEVGRSPIALPGLLCAITGSTCRMPDLEVYLACVLALVLATPADHLLPQPDRALADRVASAVLAAMADGRRPPDNRLEPVRHRGDRP